MCMKLDLREVWCSKRFRKLEKMKVEAESKLLCPIGTIES